MLAQLANALLGLDPELRACWANMTPTKAPASFNFCDVVQDGAVGEDGAVPLLFPLPPCIALKAESL